MPDICYHTFNLRNKLVILTQLKNQGNSSNSCHNANPKPWRINQIPKILLHLRERCEELLKSRTSKQNGNKSKEKHRSGIAQPVGNHRANNLSERSLLTLCYITATPHLTQPWEYKVYSIGAKNRNNKHTKRSVNSQCPQLQPPAKSTKDMAKHTYNKHYEYPQIVHIITQNITHLIHIDIIIQPIEETNTNRQWHSYLKSETKDFFYIEFFQNIN